jgi:aryl-alcohol dehydrogenase-like predicted oxidoreductase
MIELVYPERMHMHYVAVAGVKHPLSCLALGSTLFDKASDDQAFEMLDQFVAHGGNTFDTAHIYGAGACERALGRWIAARGNRDTVVIIDKGCHPIGNSGPRVTQEHIHSDIADSLERLQTSSIDLYLLHRDDERVPVGLLVEALNDEHARGRIHAFGGSNWSHRRIAEANAYASAHGLVGFAASSPNMSLARPNEPMWSGCVSLDEEARQWHTATQLPVISWSSQAGGFFTGRYSPQETSNPDMVRVYYSEANFARLERTRQLADDKHVSALHIALAWVINQPFPVVALIGPQTSAELESSLIAAQIRLTPAELAFLDGVPAAVA